MEKGMTAKVAHDTITAVRKIKAGYWYFKVVNDYRGQVSHMTIHESAFKFYKWTK
jgi:hypothetical protein